MKRSKDRHPLRRILKPTAGTAVTLFLVLSMAGLAFGSAHINMPPRATVDRDPVMLGDIAAVSGSDPLLVAALESLNVGRAPLPGESRRIDAAYVTLRLKQNGIPAEQVTLAPAAVTTLMRRSSLVSREDIETAIRNALRDTDIFQGRQGVIKDILIPKELVAPAGEVTLRVNFPENSKPAGSFPVGVSVFVDHKYFRKVWVTIKAEVLQDAVVLKYAMRRHQRITAENVQKVPMNIADLPQNAITADQDIIGQRVTKSLLAGTVLRTDTVELPPLVKRGDVVILKAATGVLRVTALGQAKSNGKQGERIRIVNIDTNKELYGYVVDAKTVKVVF